MLCNSSSVVILEPNAKAKLVPHQDFYSLTTYLYRIIEYLTKSRGNDTILALVCQFTKYAHFLSLSHPYSASTIAKVFLDNVYKLHGAPQTMVPDRDKVFTGLF